MKRILVLLSLLIAATSCDWFEFDNQEGWNAQVEGKILDSKTGQPVQFAFPNCSKIEIYEEGWDAEKSQSWYVKCNGTYRNKLAWAGKYRLQTVNQNFYPATQQFELKEGSNTVDFTVTPYARIIDPVITYEGTKIVARFKVEHADPSKTNSMDVALFGFTDRWVSDGNNNFSSQKTAKLSKIKTADGQTIIELSADTTVDSGMQFAYKRDHFLRIGAVATGSGVNSNKRYNFSPVFKMSSDFSKVEEVTDWEEDL